MFLIHNHQPQVNEGQEDRRPGPEHDTVPSPDLFHCMGTGGRSHSGMKLDQPLSEYLGQPVSQLPADGDLGNQVEDALSCGQRIGSQCDINLGLAASRGSVKKCRRP